MPRPKTVEGMPLGNSVYEEWSAIAEKLHQKEMIMLDESPQALINEVGELVSKLKPHYTERNDMGNYKPMTVEEYQAIKKQYKKCLNAFEDLSFGLDKQPDYRKVKTMLLNDYNALNRLSVNALPPLAEAIMGSFVPVAEMYSMPGDNTISGALSSREAIEFTDQNGQIHRGFFTEDKTVKNQLQAFKEVMMPYVRKYPEYKQVFEAFLRREGEFSEVVRDLTHLTDGEEEFQGFVTRVLNTDNIDVKSEKMPELREVCLNLARECEPVRKLYRILAQTKIEEGSKIAKRAGAMTDMAAAFGKNDLLAGSTRITVKRGKKEVSGVFMEEASLDSIDLKKLTRDNPYLKVDPKDFDKPEVLRSLADLQILDYLCANTDRHGNNFFFRLDLSDPEHPTLSGVQGIDNDNSFGKLENGGVMQLASEKNLKVISSDMADKVAAMTQTDLKRILEPYQFSKAEMDAAFRRLSTLKTMVRNGRHEKGEEFAFNDNDRFVTAENEIRVIRDDEWSKLTLDSLTPDPPQKQEKAKINLFYNAQGLRAGQIMMNIQYQQDKIRDEQMRNDDPEQWKEREQEIKKTEEQKKAPIRYTTSNEQTHMDAIRKQLEIEKKELKQIRQELVDVGAEKTKRSKEFKEMYGKLQEMIRAYGKCQEKIKDIKKLGEKEQALLKKRFGILAKTRKEMKAAAGVYLNKGYTYERARLDKRKKLAARLNQFASASPKSWHMFRHGVALREKQQKDLAAKDGYAFSVYQTNQLRDMMKKALYNNVASLSADNPKRFLGMKALEAQDRLWKFSQSQSAKEQPDLNQKQQVAFRQVKAESQTEKDLKTLIAYSPQIQTMIDQANEKAQSKNRPDQMIKIDSLTPRQARTVLGMLFEQEMKANGRSTIIRPQEEKSGKKAMQPDPAENMINENRIEKDSAEKNRLQRDQEEQVRKKVRLDVISSKKMTEPEKEKKPVDGMKKGGKVK